MEKEFIPYTEALALKELGFEGECFRWYQSSRLKVPTNSTTKGTQAYMREEDCTAPTFSQAFRWFREKYGLYPDIYRNGVKFNADIEDLIMGNGKETVTDEGVVYEEAELECLKKLIEIVKNK